MKIIRGDLIQLAKAGKFDVIVHGCNCFCTMGAGIAKAIKDNFPEAYKIDRESEYGARSKLGTGTIVNIRLFNNTITIVNGYTQYNYKGKKPLVEYDAVRTLFRNVKERFGGKRIGYPKIGAGLAGGDWEIIKNIIDEELLGEDHTLVVLI